MEFRRRLGKRAGLLACQVGLLVGVIALWQWGADTDRLDGSFFGSPEGVWTVLQRWFDDGTLVRESLATLRLLAVGLTLGTLAGIFIGVGVGISPMTRMIFEPILIFFNGLPRLVLQPFFIVALGIGFKSQVALVVAVIVVLVAISVCTAMDAIDDNLIINARLMGASKLELLRNVYLPWVGLDVVANTRSNVGFAFQAALVAEFVGSATGLGYLIVVGQNTFFIDSIWAALAVVVVLSVIFDQILVAVQRRANRWMPAAMS